MKIILILTATLALAFTGCQSASITAAYAGASVTIAVARPSATSRPAALPPPQTFAK